MSVADESTASQSAPTPAQPGTDPAPSAGAVLSTLNDDGSRRWLKPRVSPGKFLSGRRAAAYALISLFVALPLIHVRGFPLILLDIPARRFHILGQTFFPTDTLLLALLVVMVFLTIFWLTALFGRVWCGWACPQTVYMEFVFRPLERLFEGSPGRKPRGVLQNSGVRKPLKFAAYLVISLALAHVFLAYFVSWDLLRQWVIGAPTAHPLGFGVVMAVTAAMMFNFGYFREQVCLVACPYGRFQAVMLDRHSVTVRYDRERGEPRSAKRSAVALPVLNASPEDPGDCIDCRMCVTTCPTGIDIRNGLQMECVGCAQCIDACDTVMRKVKRPTGLIRYSSQAAMSGERFRFLRPRVVLYPIVLVLLAGLFVFTLAHTGVADVTVLRGPGQPFSVMPDGAIENNLRLKLVNRTAQTAEFLVRIEGGPGARIASSDTVRVEAGKTDTSSLIVALPRSSFEHGRKPITVVVRGPQGFEQREAYVALGPAENVDSTGGTR
ncbi:MAG: cytochrome c oxidase accessory protein CcoG [Planctomycetes bacterium]|nr:cytochrome c oxidase accessory protein CcoG [Planctomycetota bacterium]